MEDRLHGDSLLVNTPWLAPALPLAGAAFSLYAAGLAYHWNDPDLLLGGLLGAGAMLIAGRYAASPRLEITPEHLAYPRDFVTMKWRRIAWQDIDTAEFTLQSGFYWPVLVLTVHGRQKPLGIPFPMANKSLRVQAMSLIQQYVAEAKRAKA